MKLVYLLIFFSIFISCSEEKSNLNLGSSCDFDTQCLEPLSCIKGICSVLPTECEKDSDCINKCDNSPCRCEFNKCETYNPCEDTPCKEEHKTICKISNTNEPFYTCDCDENYILIEDKCTYSCVNKYEKVNETNDGCTCQNKYKRDEDTGFCIFDCNNKPHSHTNDANSGCSCDDNYKLFGGECTLDCSLKENSHINSEQTKCVCNDNYIESDNRCIVPCLEKPNSHYINNICECDNSYHETNGQCCKINQTYNTTSRSCKCDTGFYLDENICKEITPCETGNNPSNPCIIENKTICEIDGDSYICKCIEGFHADGELCCPKFYHNSNNSCVGDYNFCNNDNDCNTTLNEVCRIHTLSGELVSYCSSKNPNKKPVANYCTEDSQCESGMCHSDNYCIQLCSGDRNDDPCSGVTCSGEGICRVDEINNSPICICNEGKVSEGENCITPISAMGNQCNDGNMVTINKSGYYYGNLNDGYTNDSTGNFGECTTGNTENSDMIFKLILDSDKLVVLEITEDSKIYDSTLYVKSSCDGVIEKCSADIVEGNAYSKIKDFFSAGTYYVFVDAPPGHLNRGKFNLRVKILDAGRCPKGTDCKLKTVSINSTNGNFQICTPKEENQNAGLITRCSIDSDCGPNKHCKIDPLGTNDASKTYLGCINAYNNTCAPGLNSPDGHTGWCCAGLWSDPLCHQWCKETTDCPTGYNCETFNANLNGSYYSSIEDDYRLCRERLNILHCKSDDDCTSQTAPYCILHDNGDGRILKSCGKRAGFTKNDGDPCIIEGHKNCYNYICYNPELNNLTGDSYCSTSCEFNRDCPDLYECIDKIILFPENNPNNSCWDLSSPNCINEQLPICIKTETECTNYNSCSGNEVCKLRTNQNLYFACKVPEVTETKELGESCTRFADCKSSLCFGEQGDKYCSTKCETECGNMDCEEHQVIYAGKNITTNICVKPNL